MPFAPDDGSVNGWKALSRVGLSRLRTAAKLWMNAVACRLGEPNGETGLDAPSGSCPAATHRESNMERRHPSSLLASFVSCLVLTVAAVVLTATSAMAAPTKANTHDPTARPGNAATSLEKAAGQSDKSTHANASNNSSDHSRGNASTVGDSSKPQPLSSADKNAGGANGQCPDGPYC